MNVKKILTLIIISLFFCNTNLKAQDDPNVGFYADGIKVTELTCYSFKKLTLVLPYNPQYANYPRFTFMILITNTKADDEYDGGGFFEPMKSFLVSKYVKGKYIVITLFDENTQENSLPKSPFETSIYTTRGCLAFYKGKKGAEALLTVMFRGQNIDSYKETYDASCSCIKKQPVYSDEAQNLETIKLPLKNRALAKGNICKNEVDLTQPCTYPGTKVDFNSFGGGASFSNNNSGGSGSNSIPEKQVNRVKEKEDTEFEKNKNNGEGPYKEFTDGKVTYEGVYKNRNQFGLWKRFDQNGIITDKEYYNNKGKLDSSFAYNDKGKVIGESRWKNELKDGIWRSYSSEGVIEKMETYREDKLHGKCINYDNGKIYIESNYKEGSLNGIWKEYENGKVIKTKTYVNGEENE